MLRTLSLLSALLFMAAPVEASMYDYAPHGDFAHEQDTWTSPHDLALEEQAPVSLIPFPQQVKWLDGEMSVPINTHLAYEWVTESDARFLKMMDALRYDEKLLQNKTGG
ncbi:MAG: hypothetical protein IKL98_09220, partial [Akkermansia sp.]|nr:hypothetical protein [Akkermansia sp.]